MLVRYFAICCLVELSTVAVFAEQAGVNYDEAKIPPFTLPNPLVLNDGKEVNDPAIWQENRRHEIIELFEIYVYGRAPADGSGVHFGEVEIDENALGGTAIRKQLKIFFAGNEKGPTAHLLIYQPKNSNGTVPVFVGLNFSGNHSVIADPGIWLPTSWMFDRGNGTVDDHRATERGRGTMSSRWPVPEILSRGYAVATIYYGDIDPDYDDDFQNGVHPLYCKDNQSRPADDEWGSVAAWAWGLSRALDYIEKDDDLDHHHSAVIGHSRLGKAALWAGARDERFALVISNNSGCGGAALSRRRFGETVKQINTRFPHWFCKNFHKYNDNEDELPVDQHMLCALVAPRPLYVASAELDRWADPRGEFLSLHYASPVYELLGKQALSHVEMPAVDQPIFRDVAYHIRTGEHDITLYDWQRYMDFADLHFRGEN